VQVSSRPPAVDRSWFALEITGAPPRATVRAIGELDMLTAPHLERELDRLRGRGFCDIDLDIAGLTFVAAAGLSAFTRCDRCLRAAAGRFRLVGPTPRCRRLLAITGLDDDLMIV
jgi:anti-sigma B factor antagonist